MRYMADILQMRRREGRKTRETADPTKISVTIQRAESPFSLGRGKRSFHLGFQGQVRFLKSGQWGMQRAEEEGYILG